MQGTVWRNTLGGKMRTDRIERPLANNHSIMESWKLTEVGRLLSS